MLRNGGRNQGHHASARCSVKIPFCHFSLLVILLVTRAAGHSPPLFFRTSSLRPF